MVNGRMTRSAPCAFQILTAARTWSARLTDITSVVGAGRVRPTTSATLVARNLSQDEAGRHVFLTRPLRWSIGLNKSGFLRPTICQPAPGGISQPLQDCPGAVSAAL